MSLARIVTRVQTCAWWRERVGKRVLFRSRFSALDPRRALVKEVKGKNAFLSDDWYWIPDIEAADDVDGDGRPG